MLTMTYIELIPSALRDETLAKSSATQAAWKKGCISLGRNEQEESAHHSAKVQSWDDSESH